MLLVETYIRTSPGRGIGLFAKVDIPKGTKYWVRNEIFDKIITEKDLQTLEKLALGYLKTYGFLEITGNWYLCGDNARFSNHSKNSNSENYFDSIGLIQYNIAAEDIRADEEILCDYTEICLACRQGVVFEEM